MDEKKPEMKVDAIDPTKRNSAFNEPESEPTAKEVVCYLNGKPVGVGSRVCVGDGHGHAYWHECTRAGNWRNTGERC